MDRMVLQSNKKKSLTKGPDHTGGVSIIEAFLSPECSDDYRAVQELALHKII